jgi:hypothetical protein
LRSGPLAASQSVRKVKTVPAAAVRAATRSTVTAGGISTTGIGEVRPIARRQNSDATQISSKYANRFPHRAGKSSVSQYQYPTFARPRWSAGPHISTTAAAASALTWKRFAAKSPPDGGVPFSRADTSIRATGTPAVSAARASDRADWPTPVGESK